MVMSHLPYCLASSGDPLDQPWGWGRAVGRIMSPPHTPPKLSTSLSLNWPMRCLTE